MYFNRSTSLFLFILFLYALPLKARHEYDTEELKTPRKVIGTLASKDGVVVYFLFSNTADPRWHYWTRVQNNNPYNVEIKISIDGGDPDGGIVLGAKAKDDEMYGPGSNPKVSIISVVKTDKKPNR
jgi:hypothetical protein